jgi:hypothetical protein
MYIVTCRTVAREQVGQHRIREDGFLETNPLQDDVSVDMGDQQSFPWIQD